MGFYVGIDIGAVSATSAVLAGPGEALPGEAAGLRVLGPAVGGVGTVWLSPYRRTRGKPLAAATELLEQVIAAVGAERVRGVCLTGSGSNLAAAKLQAGVANEFRAIAAAVGALGLNVRTIFEMGGETSKYLRFSRDADAGVAIVDYATNGDCAAGTGAFIDQQAGRLRLAVEEIGPMCLSAERAAQVAGRCSVFAKSDMIHAQQKGYSPAEVLRGLCNAVARNFRAAVVRSHPVEPPVAFLGGVAANAAVVRAMREAFGLDESQMVVPEAFAHMPAIGAAVLAARSSGAADLSHMSSLRAASDSAHGVFPTQEPLRTDNVLLLRDRVRPYRPPTDGEPIPAYLGIDIGSVSTNVVAIDEAGRVIHEIYVRTQGRPIQVVTDALEEVRREWGARLAIRGVGTTGSGRELIGQLVGADTINDEITAHKTGAMFVGRTMLGGRVPDTIFEIGGQDSKFISLQDGVVVDFTMNEACAAGTGSFLEERADELDISIIGQFAEMALSSRSPIRLGERCTVFMERDVNSYLQRGADKADLVAGLAYSVVYNYINRVVRGRKIGQCVFFQGGTAYNDSVAAAFAAVTGKQIVIPPHNGVIGAIGAALLAQEKMAAGPAHASRKVGQVVGGLAAAEDGPGASEGLYVPQRSAGREAPADAPASRFRGYDLTSVGYSLREFTCKACSNTCQIQEFDVEGEKTYWGDKCSERFRKRSKTAARPVIEDLPALRNKLLLDEADLPAPVDGARTVGIPMSMAMLDQLPFWRTMLAFCGFRTVLSSPTNKKIVQAGWDAAVAEPCFPVFVAHGHVADLLERDVDLILMPNIVSVETRWMDNESHLCPWNQTLPFVVRQAPAFQAAQERFISPTVHFRQGRRRSCRQIQEAMRPLGVPARRVAAACEAGFRAQEAFRARLIQAGARALEALDRAGAPGIVLLGRAYNIHDAGVNLSVAQKLREQYGVNCIPMDFLDTAGVDIRDVNANMYWDSGRKILAAAKIVGRHARLHVIYITNFKCGPDSFIKHFVRLASGKPFLSLQFDGHSNDAGMMTRCEAYLDSKGILRPWRTDGRPAEARAFAAQGAGG